MPEVSDATSRRRDRWPRWPPAVADHVQALLSLWTMSYASSGRSRDLFDKLGLRAITRQNLERELALAAVAETFKLNDAPIGQVMPACWRSTPRFGISRLKVETASTAPTSAPA